MSNGLRIVLCVSCLATGLYRGLAEGALHRAAACGDLVLLQQTLENGADPDIVSACHGQTPLHLAAKCNQENAVVLLLLNGATINARDQLGRTPLATAARQGHLNMVKMLVAFGADARIPDLRGLTALHYAAQHGHAPTVALLAAGIADIQAATFKESLTPLHWAALWGADAALHPLLDNGADINARDRAGFTPLDWAQEYEHYSTARRLARRGGKRRSDF